MSASKDKRRHSLCNTDHVSVLYLEVSVQSRNPNSEGTLSLSLTVPAGRIPWQSAPPCSLATVMLWNARDEPELVSMSAFQIQRQEPKGRSGPNRRLKPQPPSKEQEATLPMSLVSKSVSLPAVLSPWEDAPYPIAPSAPSSLF